MIELNENALSPAPELAAALRAELARLLGCESAEVNLKVRMTELPGMDSLRLVEAVAACEQRWLVELTEDDLFDVRTGEDLCSLIAAKAHS